MHIVDIVYYWARTVPQRSAILEPSSVITYGMLARAVETAAQYFAENISDRSKPVAISIRNGSKMLVSLLGLLRAGFSVVLANPSVFKELAANSVSTLVFERETATLDGGYNIPFNEAWVSNSDARIERKDEPTLVNRTEGGDILCFTSGSTGRPKLVACPQSSWQERVRFPLNSIFFNYERILIVPAFTTSWGLSRAYEALHSGRSVCIAPVGEPMLWMINTYEIDTILISPQQALELVELQEKTTHFPLRSLKSVQIGAASIGPEAVARIKKHLCRNVILIYGTTEAGVIAVAPYDMIANTPGAAGYILPGVDLEIVDATGRILPAGQEGFVRVRSRVFSENMAASKSSDQWFYTGDLGRVAQGGLFCISGRAGDVVNRGGEKLAIPDIENFLRTCAGVRDAGVCTVTGPGGFAQVWAGLVLDSSTDIATTRFMVEANHHYKNNIDKIFVVQAIPRGALGKIQREELKKMLEEALETPAGQTTDLRQGTETEHFGDQTGR
jgi:acyl-coenzyme A synthetase/AMP-(fatty) acid ligase